MKTILVTTGVVALLATTSMALAQMPKGDQGQKEMSPPGMKEGAPVDKDAPKAGEKKEAPDKKKATKEGTKDTPKAAKEEKKQEAPDKKKATKEGTKDASKEPGKAGKAAAKGAGAVTVTSEQRTKMQTAFAKHKVQPANVNISINVGVVVPRTVRLYAIPQEIIIIVPAYRRYRYVVIGDSICIVDPDTYEIVEIIVIT